MAAPNLATAIERALRSVEDNWGDDRLHVSDLAVALPLSERKCPRELVMRLLGFKKRPLTLGELLMFKHANDIHEEIVELLRIGLEDGWTVHHVEGVVTLPGGITGRFDILLRHPSGEQYIVDLKTVRGAAFRYMDGPRQSGVIQVGGYCYSVDVPEGILLYIDREGQNFVQQYPVYLDKEEVLGAITIATGYRTWAEEYRAKERTDLPPILPPKLQRNENKGPDSVKLGLPWQCQYCRYRDVSCPSALTPTERISGIIGHIHEDGLVMKPDCEMLREKVEFILGRESA